MMAMTTNSSMSVKPKERREMTRMEDVLLPTGGAVKREPGSGGKNKIVTNHAWLLYVDDASHCRRPRTSRKSSAHFQLRDDRRRREGKTVEIAIRISATFSPGFRQRDGDLLVKDFAIDRATRR